MSDLVEQPTGLKKTKSYLPLLIGILVGITLVYQLRAFLSDLEFAWISLPANFIVPVTVVIISSVLTGKLFRIKHSQAKSYLMFTIGISCWFVAEQIRAAYDYVLIGDPFPSEADYLYIAAYPFLIYFLADNLKSVKKSIPGKFWLISIALAVAFFVPSFLTILQVTEGIRLLEIVMSVATPAASSALLAPSIIGIIFLFRKEAAYSWMLLLFAFVIHVLADVIKLFAIIEEGYYFGHPVDLLFLYVFVLLIFSSYTRIISLRQNQTNDNFFTEKIKFETVSKFGIPLILSIILLVVIVSTVHSIYLSDQARLSTESITFGIVGILAVFSLFVIFILKNLQTMVRIRTIELEEQKNNLERLVEEKTQELLKAEKLSAIGELSGRLAHDLRNPLSVMKMSIDMITKHHADAKISDNTIQDKLNSIEKSIDRISHQVDDVLDFVRLSPLNIEKINLEELIKNIMSKITVPQNIKITLPENKIQAQCDILKMEAAFINIIINAIQAMPNGGELVIRMYDDEEDIVIEFEDSGPIIPEEILPKLFDPLFTTKQKGTGLGLASCKNIVEQHGGSITVSVNPTKFIIKLPQNPILVKK